MYIKAITKEVFQTHSEARASFPQTSFPVALTDALLAEFGVFLVAPTPAPQIDPVTERCENGEPELVGATWVPAEVVEGEVLPEGEEPNGEWVGGTWTQRWSVVALSAAESAAYVASVKQQITALVQSRLDDFAKTRDYDNVLSACSYATSTHAKYGVEGQYCVAAREATWDAVYQVMAEVQAGTRPMPTGYADIEPLLPALVWPSN
jgi:hypothetical protein